MNVTGDNRSPGPGRPALEDKPPGPLLRLAAYVIGWLLGHVVVAPGTPAPGAPPGGHPVLATPVRPALNIGTCGQCGGTAAAGYPCAGCGWEYGPLTAAQLAAYERRADG